MKIYQVKDADGGFIRLQADSWSWDATAGLKFYHGTSQVFADNLVVAIFPSAMSMHEESALVPSQKVDYSAQDRLSA